MLLFFCLTRNKFDVPLETDWPNYFWKESDFFIVERPSDFFKLCEVSQMNFSNKLAFCSAPFLDAAKKLLQISIGAKFANEVKAI